MFKTSVLFNPMVVVTDETEVERLLKVRVHEADIHSTHSLPMLQPAQQASRALPHAVEQPCKMRGTLHIRSQQ